MYSVLPPSLKCRQSDNRNVWMSDVIPVGKVRPGCEIGSEPVYDPGCTFLGFQLLVFAKKTSRGHVVYDAQVDMGTFLRSGIEGCIPSCLPSIHMCAGRLDRKGDFMKEVRLLDLTFFENAVWAETYKGEMFMDGVAVNIVRGRDTTARRRGEVWASGAPIEFAFDGAGVPFRKWVEEVNAREVKEK